MFALAALVLAGGAKGFFENPEYLIGIPLMALGAIGAVIVLLGIGASRPPEAKTKVAPEAGGESAAGRTRAQRES